MENQLENLILVCWILLIPVGVLLAMVLYKVLFLLHSVSELATLARYEVYPMIQELRQTAANVEVLSSKIVAGVESAQKGVENSINAATPMVKKTAESVRDGAAKAQIKLGSVLETIGGVVKKVFQ
jgi:hypothetical protein